MPEMLSEKVAVVTGAAQGIGRGIALELLRAGARVCVADRDTEAATATAESFAADGFEAIAVAVDVTDQESVDAGARECLERFSQVDILVNNAGIHREALDRLSTVEDFQRCCDVNLFGVWRVTQAFVPHFRERGSGKIVNIASINGRIPWEATPAYSASKAAVINLTRSLAITLGADDINVNAVCPGGIQTAMADQFYGDNPDAFRRGVIEPRRLKRPLTPADIGRAVVFFASSQADMITGQSLNVDGGTVMS